MNKFITLLFILITIILGCTGDDCVEFDTPFSIEEGQTYCLPDGSEISVLSIEHSYCPCNVQCVWQGEALISLRRVTSDNIITNIDLHEELVDENPDGYAIHSISTSQDCIPVIEEVEIIIGNI